MDDVCYLPFPFAIGLCGIIPQPISAYFLTTDSKIEVNQDGSKNQSR